MQYYPQTLASICKHFGVSTHVAWRELPAKVRQVILFGSGDEPIPIELEDGLRSYKTTKPFEGVVNNLQRRWRETDSALDARGAVALSLQHRVRDLPRPAAQARGAGGQDRPPPHQRGHRRCRSPRPAAWFAALPAKLTAKQQEIAARILKEIRERLGFLNNVGLGYLTLARDSGTLSGGESQRIRLASQIGSGLTGVLYVLDEPSIGLHQRDNDRLLRSLAGLRDLGNTVIVVEHDEEAIRTADYLIDMGPGAGVHGGMVVAEGTPEEVMRASESLTGQYLAGRRYIEVPTKRRKPKKGRWLELKRCPRQQPAGCERAHPAGLLRRHHRRVRLGQILADRRHALSGAGQAAEWRARHARPA